VRWLLPERFRIEFNADVVRFLAASEPSAHSDVASELDLAVGGLPGAKTYCPNVASYAWVAACARGTRIFAVAYGMSALALRVGAIGREDALAEGAEPDIGPDWVRFRPFQPDEPLAITRERMRRFASIAFSEASRRW
jgi:hypothetical protein